MNEEYEIEALRDRFLEHANRYDEEDKKRRELYPDIFKSDAFNFARSMHSICNELIFLKHMIQSIELKL